MGVSNLEAINAVLNRNGGKHRKTFERLSELATASFRLHAALGKLNLAGGPPCEDQKAPQAVVRELPIINKKGLARTRLGKVRADGRAIRRGREGHPRRRNRPRRVSGGPGDAL